MEAHSLRICVIVTFENIRFDSNALAPRHHRNYHVVDALWSHPFHRASVVTAGCSIGASMDRLLRYFLGQFIRRGTMTFTAASGAEFTCGDGTGRPVSARFLSERTQRRILLNPELALGEAYMDGTFVVENGSIADALAILLDQPEMVPRWARLQWWLRYFGRHIRQFNRRGRARNNVAHHYDLDGRLYSLFLDADKQYSCAYFETAGRDARRCPTRQEASPCRQAPDRARDPRARHRFGLGWPWPLSGRNDRRRCHGHHAVDRNNCRSRTPVRRRRT